MDVGSERSKVAPAVVPATFATAAATFAGSWPVSTTDAPRPA